MWTLELPRPGGGGSQLPLSPPPPSLLEDRSPCDWALEPSGKQTGIWLREGGTGIAGVGGPRPPPLGAQEEQQTSRWSGPGEPGKAATAWGLRQPREARGAERGRTFP